MKKFVGKINNKTYSNEKEFLNDLSEIQSDNFDGNLLVSSYYEDIKDEDKNIANLKDMKDEKYIDKDLLVPNSKYEIPVNFEEDIKHVSTQNYRDILNFISDEFYDCDKYIKELKDKELDYVNKINQYENSLKNIKTGLEDAFKEYNYYNKLLKIVKETPCQCKESKCDGECTCTSNKKCEVPSKNINDTTYKYDIDSLVNDFNDFLKSIDFWKK